MGDLSQLWMGGVADTRTRSKPLKTPSKPWGGWVGKQIWERSPQKTFFSPSLKLQDYRKIVLEGHDIPFQVALYFPRNYVFIETPVQACLFLHRNGFVAHHRCPSREYTTRFCSLFQGKNIFREVLLRPKVFELRIQIGLI